MDVKDVDNSQYGRKRIDSGVKNLKYTEGNMQEYAQVMTGVEKNLATVFTGNTSPHIYQNGNKIIFMTLEKID